MQKAIPVLNAKGFLDGDVDAQSSFPAELRSAFETYGFVTLEGHGLDDAHIKAAYQAAERFFGLSETEKKEASISGVGRVMVSLIRLISCLIIFLFLTSVFKAVYQSTKKIETAFQIEFKNIILFFLG